MDGHRSGYTSLYNLLFYHLINKNCSVEIGIEKNASIKMWRKYFQKASIDCFELDKKRLILLLKINLKMFDITTLTLITKKSLFLNLKNKKSMI